MTDVQALPGPPPWSDPELSARNRLPMRSPLLPYPDLPGAREGRHDGSTWFSRLDGRWRFHLAPRPTDAPTGWEQPTFEDAAWEQVDVPGCFTMQGFDRPIYTNIQMPFDRYPPEVPDANPTGLYRTTFTVPRLWTGRRIVLHVGAAESVLLVWIDGTPVLVSKDSRLAAEVDVTDHVRPGSRQTLAAMVVRWSDASYLEDQDQWWQAGIHREVFLYATGAVHIADVHATAGLAGDGRTGSLDLRVHVGFPSGAREAGWRVEAHLETLGGRALLREPLGGVVPTDAVPYLYEGPMVRMVAAIPGIEPWSAEQPHLYRVLVTLIDPEGIVREVVADRIGFRSIEVRDRKLLVNGRAVLIRGVNRHDFDERTGRVISEESMRADLVLMKQFGFNAVRTSHYPNHPTFYDLCDELGLYVVDEANIEAHGFITSLCHDPRYLEAWMERGSRMVRRDKNHPSIIMWSLGNESGYGASHDALAGWIRGYDPSRPLHYEGAIFGWWDRPQRVTDVVCPMYPEIAEIVAWAETGADKVNGDLPLIMCEYQHAMGNSNGTLGEYWDAIEAHDGLQGGFIWEWWDHGLRQRLPDGRERWAYGGDFGDEPNDGSFCIDGLVWPDRRPKPGMWEHRHLASPVDVQARDLRRGRLTVVNRQDFTDLSWLRARFELLVDGIAAVAGEVTLPEVAPGESGVLELPMRVPTLEPGQEAVLTLRFATAHALPWAPAGFEVAVRQLPVRTAAPRKARRAAGEVTSTRADGRIAIVAGETGVTVDETTGTLASVRLGEHELLAAGPRLTLWRPPTDNDEIRPVPGFVTPASRWRAWGLDALTPTVLDTKVRRKDGGVSITTRLEWRADESAGLITQRRVVTVLPDGSIRLEEDVRIPETLDDLPRVGMLMVLRGGHDRLIWYGRGPHESYPDRRRGAPLGRWAGTVAGEYVPYIRPQEHGLHTDARWCAVGATAGPALLVTAGDPFAFSASHHSPEDIDRATHDVELTPRPEVYLHVDRAHRGVGTAACGPDTLPQYLVRGGRHRWTWRLRPFDARGEDPARLARDLRAPG